MSREELVIYLFSLYQNRGGLAAYEVFQAECQTRNDAMLWQLAISWTPRPLPPFVFFALLPKPAVPDVKLTERHKLQLAIYKNYVTSGGYVPALKEFHDRFKKMSDGELYAMWIQRGGSAA